MCCQSSHSQLQGKDGGLVGMCCHSLAIASYRGRMAVAACQVPGARGSFTSVRGLGLMPDLNRHQIFPPVDGDDSIS